MFSHVMIGTNDLEKAKSFYDAALGTLGVRPARVDGHRIFYMTKTGVFSVTKPIDGKPACHANGGTIGFAARPVKTRRASARARRASSISPICAIPTATRSALCTAWFEPGSHALAVMAGLDPAIHVFLPWMRQGRGCPARGRA